ncbi:dirigent protein 10-like [Passer montanus]|uniref:dirigent protein 10-like n=1 Tax=Passer montanus TaxID=9160 RepID=UPI00195F564B|nr:dirigent protein 10-like [Passer montanus]
MRRGGFPGPPPCAGGGRGRSDSAGQEVAADPAVSGARKAARCGGPGARAAPAPGSSGGRAGRAAGAAFPRSCAAHSPGASAPGPRRAGRGPPPAPLTLRDDAQRAFPVNRGEIRDRSLSESPPLFPRHPRLSPRPTPRPLPFRKLRVEDGGTPKIKR